MRIRVLALVSGLAVLVAGPSTAEEAAKTDYRINSVARPKPPASTGGTLYRSVDANGKVVFSDRPKEAGDKGVKAAQGNVASPEARRQMNIELQNRNREEYADRAAAAQRQQAAQRREYEEAMRKRQEYEAQNPGDAPRHIRIVR
jgi:hypothetical protein